MNDKLYSAGIQQSARDDAADPPGNSSNCIHARSPQILTVSGGPGRDALFPSLLHLGFDRSRIG